MKHSKVLLVSLSSALACLLTASTSAHAQSLFLERGQSAAGADVGFAFNDNASILTIGGGYARNGWLDLNLHLNRFFTDDGANHDLRAIGIQPGVNVHVLKQDAVFPVSVTVGGTFQYIYYDTDLPDMKTSAWSLVGNAGVYRQFVASPMVRVIPQALVFVRHTSVKSKLGNMPSESVSDTQGGASFLCHFAFDAGSGPLWTLSPALTIDSDNATVGIFAGAIFR